MKRFLTEYIGENGHRYGSDVFANNWDEAQANADLLYLGKVVGEHIMTIDTDGP